LSQPAIAICDGRTGDFARLWTSDAFAAAGVEVTAEKLRDAVSGNRPASLELDGGRIDALPLPPGVASVWVLRYADAEAPRLDMDAVHDLDTVIVLYTADDLLLWYNKAYERVLGPNAHLLRIGAPFEEIMTAAYHAGHAATEGEDIDTLIARRLARHKACETFEEALSGGRRLKTEEIATATGILGVRNEI
jgi:hypothetical protein